MKIDPKYKIKGRDSLAKLSSRVVPNKICIDSIKALEHSRTSRKYINVSNFMKAKDKLKKKD